MLIGLAVEILEALAGGLLSKKLGDKAMEIRNELSKYFMVDYDDTGSIGKRYRREDEIGTPYCITVALSPSFLLRGSTAHL